MNKKLMLALLIAIPFIGQLALSAFCESHSSICHRPALFPLLALAMDCTHTNLHIYHL